MVKRREEGGDVTLELADIVAKAMKEWAIEKGATHYTHIFQPYIVSIGAEKHDSFADIPKGGKIENSFSGKDLLMGCLLYTSIRCRCIPSACNHHAERILCSTYRGLRLRYYDFRQPQSVL